MALNQSLLKKEEENRIKSSQSAWEAVRVALEASSSDNTLDNNSGLKDTPPVAHTEVNSGESKDEKGGGLSGHSAGIPRGVARRRESAPELTIILDDNSSYVGENKTPDTGKQEPPSKVLESAVENPPSVSGGVKSGKEVDLYNDITIVNGVIESAGPASKDEEFKPVIGLVSEDVEIPEINPPSEKGGQIPNEGTPVQKIEDGQDTLVAGLPAEANSPWGEEVQDLDESKVEFDPSQVSGIGGVAGGDNFTSEKPEDFTPKQTAHPHFQVPEEVIGLDNSGVSNKPKDPLSIVGGAGSEASGDQIPKYEKTTMGRITVDNVETPQEPVAHTAQKSKSENPDAKKPNESSVADGFWGNSKYPPHFIKEPDKSPSGSGEVPNHALVNSEVEKQSSEANETSKPYKPPSLELIGDAKEERGTDQAKLSGMGTKQNADSNNAALHEPSHLHPSVDAVSAPDHETNPHGELNSVATMSQQETPSDNATSASAESLKPNNAATPGIKSKQAPISVEVDRLMPQDPKMTFWQAFVFTLRSFFRRKSANNQEQLTVRDIEPEKPLNSMSDPNSSHLHHLAEEHQNKPDGAEELPKAA